MRTNWGKCLERENAEQIDEWFLSPYGRLIQPILSYYTDLFRFICHFKIAENVDEILTNSELHFCFQYSSAVVVDSNEHPNKTLAIGSINFQYGEPFVTF